MLALPACHCCPPACPTTAGACTLLGLRNCLQAAYGDYIGRVLKRTLDSVLDEWQAGEPTDLLKRLAGPRMLWQAGLLEDAQSNQQLSSALCTRFVTTPLWTRYVTGQLSGEVDGSSSLQPGLSGGAAGADWSSDMLPALYMVGAGLPEGCSDELLFLAEPYLGNASSLAALALPILKALQQCYLEDAEQAEAQRCLYALPSVALALGEEATSLFASQTLPWLMSLAGGKREWLAVLGCAVLGCVLGCAGLCCAMLPVLACVTPGPQAAALRCGGSEPGRPSALALCNKPSCPAPHTFPRSQLLVQQRRCCSAQAGEWQTLPPSCRRCSAAWRAPTGGTTPLCSSIWQVCAALALQYMPFCSYARVAGDCCLPAGLTCPSASSMPALPSPAV